jgi:hypothetical protein
MEVAEVMGAAAAVVVAEVIASFVDVIAGMVRLSRTQ